MNIQIKVRRGGRRWRVKEKEEEGEESEQTERGKLLLGWVSLIIFSLAVGSRLQDHVPTVRS
jgi:hypothetical protein